MSAADPRCVLFRAGGERFALPLGAVQEVVRPQPPFARVPRSGPAVRCAMNLRGRVVALVDLATLLGLPRDAAPTEDGQVIVLAGEGPGLGLLVASVGGVEALAPGGSASGCVRGVAEARDGAATVLEPAAVALEATSHFGAR